MKRIVILSALMLATHLVWQSAAAPAAAQKPANDGGADAGFSGKVVETMNAAGYTYALVDTGSAKKWVAAPVFAVKVGDQASVAGSMAMPNHHSKTLNRDFDLVFFAPGVSVNGRPPTSGGPPATQPALPPNHPAIGTDPATAAGLTSELPKNHPPISGLQASAKVDFTGLKKPEGGRTVAEVCAGSATLQGREVKLRGKVVKYNPQILGKNWLHVRDGTGENGSNDLLVTTTNAAKVGDTVLVTGVVATNKDFGAHYRYPVMIDNAKVKIE